MGAQNPITSPLYRLDLAIVENGVVRSIEFGTSYCHEAKKRGLQARAFRGAEAVHVFSSGIEKKDVDELVRTWGEAYNEPFRLTMSELNAWGLPDTFETNELFSGRITKAFLMNLPAGAWLYLQGSPKQFDETITELTDRQRLWDKMIEGGRGNSPRYVLWRESDVKALRGLYDRRSLIVPGL